MSDNIVNSFTLYQDAFITYTEITEDLSMYNMMLITTSETVGNFEGMSFVRILVKFSYSGVCLSDNAATLSGATRGIFTILVLPTIIHKIYNQVRKCNLINTKSSTFFLLIETFANVSLQSPICWQTC